MHSQYFLRFYNRDLTFAEVRALTSGIPVTYIDSGASMTTLITNGSMEADANWANYGTPTTQERSVTQKHSGTYSRKFTVNAANEGIQGDAFITATGKKYRHIVWVYPSGTAVNIGVQKGDNSGWLDNSQYPGLNSGAWNRIVVNLTESAGGGGAFIVIHSGAETSGTWYVDDIWGGAIGLLVEYNSSAMHILQWGDNSSNENHGDVANAIPSNLPVGHNTRYVKKGITSNTTFGNALPPLYAVKGLVLEETAGDAVVLEISTFAGRDDIIAGFSLGSVGMEYVNSPVISSGHAFSLTSTRSLIVESDTWGTSSINVWFLLEKVM